MAMKIRLQMQGSKKNPQFLIVAMDSGKKRDGQYLERLGHYFPKKADDKDKIKIDMAKFDAWKAKGAQVSETVGQLVKSITK